MEPSKLPFDFAQGVLSARGPLVSADGKDWKAEEIEKLFPPLGYFTAVLDGSLARDKRTLLCALAAALKFPSYFGHNWDALLDCMRSLPEFAPAKGYALIIKNSGRLLADSPEDRDTFNDIAVTAADFLNESYKTPLKIIML
ncbi:MAG: barstar family protein [Elusimicrobia bacterium]|nr:barstar family protein [Elusimicrobiota bacterium]